jgi:pimeloyl-ACP methyl ester carboxylesterase
VSEQFCDVGRDIELCYETFGEPSDPTALLIMGLGTQMVAWHEDFCRELADRGLHVVRFDNRDIGRSTHVSGRPPTVAQLLARSRGAAHYSLADMADDAAQLLERLELAPAHIVGASMGGMIAQTLAARHPQLVRSLTSIMSNTGARRSGQPSLRVYPMLLRRAPRGREAYVAHMEGVFNAIGSRGLSRDLDDMRALAATSYERNHDAAGPGRQLAAIMAAGDRTPELRRITAPTLVIHGTADPLVAPSGGRATARAIAGAKLMTVEGMGHDLPRAAWPQLIDAIATHALRGSEQSAPASALSGSAATVNNHSNGNGRSYGYGNLSLPARPPSRAGS